MLSLFQLLCDLLCHHCYWRGGGGDGGGSDGDGGGGGRWRWRVEGVMQGVALEERAVEWV